LPAKALLVGVSLDGAAAGEAEALVVLETIHHATLWRAFQRLTS